MINSESHDASPALTPRPAPRVRAFAYLGFPKLCCLSPPLDPQLAGLPRRHYSCRTKIYAASGHFTSAPNPESRSDYEWLTVCSASRAVKPTWSLRQSAAGRSSRGAPSAVAVSMPDLSCGFNRFRGSENAASNRTM